MRATLSTSWEQLAMEETAAQHAIGEIRCRLCSMNCNASNGTDVRMFIVPTARKPCCCMYW
eukprot:CAMPEP_0180638622 /NCGR_PEP_ID=MMETSP1037_2-20121125/44449_1 /TAXON_ID=632150 /ORGANISM="Azadinium spinosum, Strain 3D9" /LENGTH=60 /DNA_ID=CAMNT_0022660215 /DNA_START=252 /DNA_END=437 /DNA_ORIENTATION=+